MDQGYLYEIIKIRRYLHNVYLPIRIVKCTQVSKVRSTNRFAIIEPFTLQFQVQCKTI